MTLLRRLALPCLLLVGLAGCTEGQKTNPLPRATRTTMVDTRPADTNLHAFPAGPREGTGTTRKD
jgi:hypothetical protein